MVIQKGVAQSAAQIAPQIAGSGRSSAGRFARQQGFSRLILLAVIGVLIALFFVFDL